MVDRTARCVCGGLTVATTGDPVKVSACHCASCRMRTGSAFSVAVFFPEGAVTVRGDWRPFTRLGDSGLAVEFGFCPMCGSTVFWRPRFRPGWVGVALGCFPDDSMRPTQSVYEAERRSWVRIDLPDDEPGR